GEELEHRRIGTEADAGMQKQQWVALSAVDELDADAVHAECLCHRTPRPPHRRRSFVAAGECGIIVARELSSQQLDSAPLPLSDQEFSRLVSPTSIPVSRRLPMYGRSSFSSTRRVSSRRGLCRNAFLPSGSSSGNSLKYRFPSSIDRLLELCPPCARE